MWYYKRNSGVVEKYVGWCRINIKKSMTAERSAMAERLKIKVGFHQVSVLSPFLYAIVIDRLTDETNKESPWTMLFADDFDLW